MILAFVVVGGFLYWLNVTAQPTEVAIDEGPEVTESGASVSMSLVDFLANPALYDGQIVEVTGARVAGRLGAQAFWVGPDASPFLVKMAPALVEANTEVMAGLDVTLVGPVSTLTNEVLAVWDSLGAFPNEGDRIVAEFAVGRPFIEATAILMPVPAGGEGGGGDSGS
jgi:hypothetical protein